jgi:(4-(4-[2-(gamma-L-glutamylamino)ethyl]phenoxymethyl)furan-2-yl)methanamine synthase
MISMGLIGIDIGGANIKVSDAQGRCRAIAFPIWIQHASLADSMKSLLESYPAMNELAVTMTGELADCFATRRAGVCKILDQVEMAVDGCSVAVYAVGDRWLSPSQARKEAWSVAASNWFALATWVGRCVSPSAKEAATWLQPMLHLDRLDLIIDAGSTTVDIIPMSQIGHGVFGPIAQAKTDRQRMQLGQLVYTGMQRTPVAAIVSELDINGERCPVMAERFATSDDCYVAVGAISEAPEDCDSADGRSRTKKCALARLARMVGEDIETLTEPLVVDLAHQIIQAQATRIADAIARNLPVEQREFRIVIAGHGRPLVTRALEILKSRGRENYLNLELRWLDQIVSPEVARSAPATAVAVLRSSHLLNRYAVQ